MAAAVSTPVLGQNTVESQAPSSALPCATASQPVPPAQLYGIWQVDALVDAQADAPQPSGAAPALLRLHRHPEFSSGLRGQISRATGQAQVAGEFDGSELLLEESADGQRIDATWSAQLVPGSCGRELRGVWTRDGATVGTPFVLRKQAGSWH